jgi:drug/metabolite transporter (DMT)-like permease
LLYFASFNFAPAVEVSLINYLWPVLIIVFTGCLSREHVRWNHLAGAALGLLGISVLMLREGQATWTFSQGHLLALLAAVEWAGFSVMNRRLKHYSSDVVPMSFLVTGAVFLALHFCFEPGPLRIGLEAAVSITVLGLSSVFAYYLWDVGMKHGNIQVLGALSYITPLASTLMLMLFAKTEPSPVILASAVLVALGGKLAAKKA